MSRRWDDPRRNSDYAMPAYHEREESKAESKDSDDTRYLVRRVRTALQREVGSRQSIKDLFREIDENGDGTITAWEFRRGLRNVFGFAKLSEFELQELINFCDLNGNGKISYREFETFVESRDFRDGDVEEVLARLREDVEDRYAYDAVQRVFEEFDTDYSGAIELDELHQGFREHFGIKLTVGETALVMKAFSSSDPPSDGRRSSSRRPRRNKDYVRYREFLAAMRGVEPRSHSYRDPSSGHRSANFAVRRLADEIKRCARMDDAVMDFRRVFEDMDRDGSGTLDRREVDATLKRLGVNLSRSELIDVMVFLQGGADDDEITIDTFLQFALQQDPGTKRLLDRVRNEIDRIAQRLKRPPDYRQAFRELDLDGSGSITEGELRSAMRNLHLRLSNFEVRQIIRMFDADGNYRISCREFVDFMESMETHRD